MRSTPQPVWQLACSSALALLLGAPLSLNVFTLAVERAAAPRGALRGVWPLGTSLVFCLSAASMAATSRVLDRAAERAKPGAAAAPPPGGLNAHARVGLKVAAGYALLCVAASGVALSSAPLVLLAVAAVALPFGALTVLVLQHNAAWLPRAFGLGVGLATFFGGLGAIVCAVLFNFLLDVLPVTTAIFAAGVALSAAAIALSLLLRLPADAPPPAQAGEAQEGEPLVRTADSFPKLDVATLWRLPMFWLYIATIVLKRSSFAMTPYFFSLGAGYGASKQRLLLWHQACNAGSLLFNLVYGSLSDVLRARAGPFSCGARNVGLFTAVTQAGVFALLAVAVRGAADFRLWVGAVALLRLSSQAHSGLAALLAHDFFGPQNMVLAFGTGGSLGICAGELLSTAVMWGIDKYAGGAAHGSTQRFRYFYLFGFVSSALCVVGLVLMRRQTLRRKERGDGAAVSPEVA